MTAARLFDGICPHPDMDAAAFPFSSVHDVGPWFGYNRAALLERVKEAGWALVRGVPVADAQGFAEAIQGLGIPLAGHYSDLPFHPETEHVFHTTAYPKADEILFHNESAHQRSAPRLLFFCCIAPASSGGETPISDGVAALGFLPDGLLRRLRDRGLLYKRRFRPGLDVDWHSALGTSNRDAVEAIYAADGVAFDWRQDGGLAIKCAVPALALSLGCGEALCHQVALFHPYFLPPEVRELMVQAYGDDELPRTIAFGDGAPMPDADAWALHEASLKSAFVFAWRQGDILILDNFRMAHGRRSYSGDRVHFVMMSAMERRPMSCMST